MLLKLYTHFMPFSVSPHSQELIETPFAISPRVSYAHMSKQVAFMFAEVVL